VVQVNDYYNLFRENILSLPKKLDFELNAFNPKRAVIIGTYEKELDNPKKKASFELFRSSLSGVDVITFDEFFNLPNGCAGLFVEVVRTVRPFLGQREQDRSERILIFRGKRSRLGDGPIQYLCHAIMFSISSS
jgi:hypothetical protein